HPPRHDRLPGGAPDGVVADHHGDRPPRRRPHRHHSLRRASRPGRLPGPRRHPRPAGDGGRPGRPRAGQAADRGNRGGTVEGAGRDVVVPTNTFCATAGAVLHAGGVPRFADVAPGTMALSEATVEAVITSSTAAVVLVHIGGLITPEVDAIADLCRRRGLVLIEDAAHAHGSSFDGRPAGSFGLAAAFSFYPTKVITSGEGGMI